MNAAVKCIALAAVAVFVIAWLVVIHKLENACTDKGGALVQTPTGYACVPTIGGKP